MSRDVWAALPRGAKGLSAVCDCGISLSYSLTIFVVRLPLKTGFLASRPIYYHYTTISYLSVQQSKLSPRGAVDDPMALLHEAEGRGQQCIGSSTAPRV